MRNLFPGYFTPTEEEFPSLWSDCLFAFDANVLLGLYRSSPETQEVFFSVLEKISDRIFLPNQAANEYLRNRLNVISIRAESYGKIKAESEKFAKFVASTVQEHALPSREEIATIAEGAAESIRVLVEAASEGEPDLLRSDHLLNRVADFFENKTGPAYSHPRLKEIYDEGSRRYALGLPPGYKDDKKAEPDKYGDLLIWLQLIDQAKLTKRSLIFVTGDSKEDWWFQHKGGTFGPRPELRQEMMTSAGVSFYMYTTPRFLEFAKQFLNLKFDTKPAESEFAEIEKQDKEATARNAQHSTDYYMPYSTPSFRVGPPVSMGYLGMQPAMKWDDLVDYYANEQTRQSWGAGYVAIPSPGVQVTSSPHSAEPVDYKAKNKYFALLPIHGVVYQSGTGKWKCEIVGHPSSGGNDLACYRLKFESQDYARDPRYLSLWVSLETLEKDLDWRYKSAVSKAISEWLASNQSSSEIVLRG